MIPSSVKIGGVVYNVYEAESVSDDENILLGEVDYHKATIYINEDNHPDMKEQTLLHEMIHVILRMMGKGDLNEDEYFVDALAYNLHQVLKENKIHFGEEE